MQALLELKGRLLVEAALEEVVSLITAHLDVLQVPTRLAVLQRLWPMIALLQSPTDRLTAFAHSWRAALELALSANTANTVQGNCWVVTATNIYDEYTCTDGSRVMAMTVAMNFGAEPGSQIQSV